MSQPKPATQNNRTKAGAEASPAPAAIAVQQLTDGYGRTPVLTGIDLQVGEGDFFALLGRNGAGKSTLVQSVLGFRRPQRGRLNVLGVDPWHERRTLMREVALVPETPNVPPHMTVGRAARFVATFLPRGRFDRTHFDALLDEDEIAPQARFGRLSRGQKSSVGLALALASRPRLLVLDDPTLGLDAVARRRAYRRLIEHQAEHGSTIFLTTHDLAAVDGLATHVGFLHRTELPVVGEVEELKQRFRLADVTATEDAERLPGRVVRLDTGALGGRALIELDADSIANVDDDPGLTQPTVEDLFVALLEEPETERRSHGSSTDRAA